jgi:hypothetical protein
MNKQAISSDMGQLAEDAHALLVADLAAFRCGKFGDAGMKPS